jgi:hypothetical protein
MSRPRSARSNAPAVRGAAARGGRPGVFVSTPKSDIYVVMLSIALGAMFLGSLLLVLILSRYDFKLKVAGNVPIQQSTTLAHLEKIDTVLL